MLHDLGPALADGGLGYFFVEETEEMATASEWRTPPLWGIAATAPYLHDGRAATLEDAILAHGGEAESAMVAYSALEYASQRELLDFLASL